MDFNIEPKVGVTGLALGSSKATVRQFFGIEPKVFQRTPNDTHADYWADQGVFAYYDENDALEALEFASPAEAKLNGSSLSGVSMAEARVLLQGLDPKVDVSEAGASVRSARLGVSLWCPTPDEPDAMVEAVLVCGDDYFD